MTQTQDTVKNTFDPVGENDVGDYYRTLFNSIDEGFCIIEVLFDDDQKPFDYRFIEVNPAFELHTGLKDAVGKTIREFAPGHEKHWFEIYGKVALTGEPARFQNTAEQLGRFYNVYAYRFGQPEKHQVAVLFNDITKQKKAEAEILQKEIRFSTTLDNLQEGCAIIGFDWTYLYVNEVNAKHAHSTKKELLGKNMIEAIPGIDSSKFFTVYKKCMEERKYQHIEDSFTFADGTKEWFESFAHPVPEGIFVLSMNITERKKSEEVLKQALHDKEILLRELYHRTKNNMQVISSLLNIRGSKSSDQTLRSSFFEMRDRIRSMSLVHERLYQSKSLSKIKLNLYIQELVDLLINSHTDEKRINVNYDLLDIDVSIDIAIPCGLIITELVLNGIKYAFPDRDRGNLDVKLESSEKGIIKLKIKDDGVGITDKEIHDEEGFGIQLIKGLIEDQLNGEFILDNSDGTAWTIIIKEGLYTERV
jgi:PAS domain S-box-containing protein